MTRGTVATAVLMSAALVGAGQNDTTLSVSEGDGTYAVSARFVVPEPLGIVREVLTDYENIPRFMPDVRRSVIVGRGDQRVRVEQEAVATYLTFSKKVRLVLDVDEGDEVITFRDRGHMSFREYEGSWTVRESGTGTLIEYQLSARPAFSVPRFVLRKLLTHDAGVMVERLRAEIRVRVRQSS